MEAEYVKINTNFLKLLEEYKLKGYVVENTNKNHVPLESTRSILLELSVKMIMNILIVQCTAICVVLFMSHYLVLFTFKCLYININIF